VPKFLNRQRLIRVLFWTWGVVLFVAASSLMAAHVYALPKPDAADQAMGRALNQLRSASDKDRWLVVHVLYAECKCSRRILDHLATSDRVSGVSEKLLLVGHRAELEARLGEITARGFSVVKTSSKELRDRFHVQAAPLLLVIAPDGTVRYTGGYTDRKQGLGIRDVAIVRDLVASGTANELPLFGCATSKELQELLDPLALRARSNP
jgi:hypothetical protein